MKKHEKTRKIMKIKKIVKNHQKKRSENFKKRGHKKTHPLKVDMIYGQSYQDSGRLFSSFFDVFLR